MDRSLSRRRGGWAVFAVAFAVYLNVLYSGFVWDDHYFVLGRDEIRQGGDLPALFSQDVRGLYRPVRTVAYVLAWRLFGESPLGWHLLGPLFHASVTLLFFLVAARIVGRPAAFLAAVLFAVHPVHTERVSHVTGSMDLLGVLFMMAAWAAALRGGYFTDRIPRARRWALPAAGLFALALLSSEEAALLPAYLALLLLWRSRAAAAGRRPASRSDALLTVGALVTAAGYWALRTAILGGSGRAVSYAAGSFGTTFLTMGQVYLRYFRLMVHPADLRMEYVIRPAVSIWEPRVLAGYGLLAALAILAVVLYHRRRVEGLPLAWMLAALAPFTNLLPGPELIAERYLYVPSMGFCLLAGLLAGRLVGTDDDRSPSIRRFAAIAFGVLAALFALQTVMQNRLYRDDCALFGYAMTKEPRSDAAHNNLGACLDARGEHLLAERQFRLAVEINPANDRARYNLAKKLWQRGDPAGALGHLSPVVDTGSARDNVRFLYGVVTAELPRAAPAAWIEGDAVFLVGRGVGHRRAGDAARAAWSFARALEDGDLPAPYRDEARRNLAELPAPEPFDNAPPSR